MKDLILLTAGAQLLSLFSNYFWLLLLLVRHYFTHRYLSMYCLLSRVQF